MNSIVDLTMTYRSGMPGVDIQSKYTIEADGWNASTLELYSHAGTHMDAPFHFGVSEETIDEMPLDRCMGTAWVVNLTHIKPGALIKIDHLGNIAESFQTGESLLMHTNWSRHYGNFEYYRDHFPRISEELAHWCAEKSVKILGVESLSVADVNNLEEVTRIHQILLGGQIVIVEGLCNLDQLTTPKVHFVAAPIKYLKGDGAPCRAFAMPIE